MCSISPRRISATYLALVLIYIYPTILKAFLNLGYILLSKWCKCLKANLLCFIKCILLGNIWNHWCVNVVHMKLVKSKIFLAKGYISVKLIQILVNCLYKILIYDWRHIVLINWSLKCWIIFSNLGVENQLLNLSIVKAGVCVEKLLVGSVVLLESFFSYLTVSTLKTWNKSSMCKSKTVSIFICYLWECHISIVKYIKCICSNLWHLKSLCNYLLHLWWKSVSLKSPNLSKLLSIKLQFRNLLVVLV